MLCTHHLFVASLRPVLCSTEQRKTDETAFGHPTNDVRLGTEASQVYQHEWSDGRPHEDVQITAVHECLDRT